MALERMIGSKTMSGCRFRKGMAANGALGVAFTPPSREIARSLAHRRGKYRLRRLLTGGPRLA
jgi:hypothetical protein